MSNMQQISARISPELYRKVKIKLAQTGKTLTAVIREKLEEWSEENDKTKNHDENTENL